MSIRNMLGNSLDEKKWRFVPAAGCCPKCEAWRGKVISSRTEPKFGPHGGPLYDSKNNCRCEWVEEKE